MRHSHRSGLAGLAVATIAFSTMAAPAAPASASDPAETGLFQTFTADNGTQLRYHSFDGGDNGVVFYLDGDGTTSFDTPQTSSSSASGARGHVQRIRKAAAAEGFDLIFLDHPGQGESWWDGVDTDAVVPAVEELVTASGASRAQFVGYSGGAEFLARHLLIDDTSWLPDRVGAAMVGGGGVSGESPDAPDGSVSEANLNWVVGEEDSYGATAYTSWSALESARQGSRAYAESGFDRARVQTIPNTDHSGYDFAGITRTQLQDLAKAEGSTDEPSDTTTRSPGKHSPTPKDDGRSSERSRGNSASSEGSTRSNPEDERSIEVPDPTRPAGTEGSEHSDSEVTENQEGITEASPKAEAEAAPDSSTSAVAPTLTIAGVLAVFASALLFFVNRRAKRRHR